MTFAYHEEVERISLLRAVGEEIAAIAAISLFVAMILVWGMVFGGAQ